MLDFFFLAVVVVVAPPDCCGLGAGEETLARLTHGDSNPGAEADAPLAQMREARTSDVLIKSLLIFPRMGSLLRAAGFQH